jgi:predicted TIM-barrel fold metal-dependent hydrolase
MLIDIHAHTTERTLWGLHTATATISDLELYAAQFKIQKILLMATYFPFKGGGQPNAKVLGKVEGNSSFGVCGSLDAMNHFKEGLAELRELVRQERIVGIKLYPGYQDFRLGEDKMNRVYELAAENRLPIVIHTGHLHHCCPRQDRQARNFRCGQLECAINKLQPLSMPSQVIVPAQKFPEVNFVLAHMSKPYIEELLEVMALCPNVYTDTSGLLVSGDNQGRREDTPTNLSRLRTEIAQVLDLPGGVGRIMFGTDFPIQSYSDSIMLVDSLEIDETVKEKIRWQTARRVFNLQI